VKRVNEKEWIFGFGAGWGTDKARAGEARGHGQSVDTEAHAQQVASVKPHRASVGAQFRLHWTPPV
jgi:hypothetical protein